MQVDGNRFSIEVTSGFTRDGGTCSSVARLCATLSMFCCCALIPLAAALDAGLLDFAIGFLPAVQLP